MKVIAFIHPFVFRYHRGIERFTISLSSALVAKGAEVDILTWRWRQPVSWGELDERVSVIAFPTSRYYASKLVVPLYIAHLLRHSYDQIIIFFADYGEAPAVSFLRALKRKLNFSIVLQYPYSQVPNRYETLVGSGLAASADRLIVVSDFVAREAEKFTGRSCTVIPNGVDADVFKPNPAVRPRVRAELGLPEDAPLLLTVAALEERKGVQWVLRALPSLLGKFPRVRYLIVGDGPYRTTLERLARELDVVKHVRFLNGGTDIARFYQAADLKLLLSKGEAFPLAVLEALACGIPVIASQHPPYNEMITPKWGRLENEKNTAKIVQGVESLLSTSDARLQMGRAGRSVVLENYTWDRIAEKYLALF